MHPTEKCDSRATRRDESEPHFALLNSAHCDAFACSNRVHCMLLVSIGTCVNVGCVPKKVMWNTAMIAESLHDAKDYGFLSEPNAIKFDWSVIKKSRDAYIKRLNVRISLQIWFRCVSCPFVPFPSSVPVPSSCKMA